jgi:hypothetical protein
MDGLIMRLDRLRVLVLVSRLMDGCAYETEYAGLQLQAS